jgi:hypothetical protein
VAATFLAPETTDVYARDKHADAAVSWKPKYGGGADHIRSHNADQNFLLSLMLTTQAKIITNWFLREIADGY